MEIEKLKQKLHDQKNKIGLVRGVIKIDQYDEAEQNISASINPQNWNIQVSLRKSFDPRNDNKSRLYMKKKGIQDGLEKLISDVVTHEFAHWELPVNSNLGCPYNLYEHDKILEAVKKALPEDKQSHSSYVANAFEDMIINPRCREFNKDFSGQVLFWKDQGLICENQRYTPFYEAFVKLNMHLFGDRWDKALLGKHYTNDKKINNVVKKIIEELHLGENIKDSSVLFDRARWPEMAEDFARILSPLLETAPRERLSAYEEGTGDKNDFEQKSGNGIEQKLKTKDGKEEIAFGRYSSDESQSTNLTSYEQLDSLYRKLAKPLTVRVEAMTKDAGLNITPLTYKPFDPENHDITKIKLNKLFVTDEGLRFAYPDQPLTISSKSKVQRRSFPDFKMVVLDNSGSMKSAIDDSNNIGNTSFIPWGDNSKYHYALLGFYGIENFLQNQGIAQYIQHGLSLFSSSTRFKQSDFSGIDEVRKLALAPEFGGTYIDAKILKKALEGRESFVLSMSDGEVGNWDSEKSAFIELAKNNHYAHIQLGSETQFSRDLKSMNIPIFSVNSGDDLSKLMVDITKKTYDNYIRSKQ